MGRPSMSVSPDRPRLPYVTSKREAASALMLDNTFVAILVHFSLVRFKTVSMRSEKPVGAPPRLSDVIPNVSFETVPTFVR